MQNREHNLALLVEAPGGVCAFPVNELVETMRPLPLEPLPDMPRFISGLAVIRGAPVPVVELGAILSPQPAQAGLAASLPAEPLQASSHRWVTVRTGERTVAVAVARVIGIAEISPGELEDMPPLLKSGRAEVIEAIGNLDDRLMVTLRTARLVPDAVWQAIERGKAAQ
jgi:purine-binding chemotaxis protein CheW